MKRRGKRSKTDNKSQRCICRENKKIDCAVTHYIETPPHTLKKNFKEEFLLC